MIDVLTPPITVTLILLVIATTVLVGHASKEVILKVTEKLFGIGTGTALGGPLEKLFTYSALGFAFIIIYGILLSVFTFLNQTGVLLVIGFSVIVESLTLIRRKKGEKISSITRITKEHVKNFLKKPGQVFLAALFVMAVLWYFYPVIGLASYPGGDDKAYIFVTKQIIERGTAFSAINYPYAQPYLDHILQAGFMLVSSFFYDLLQIVGLPTSIPLLHLFLALLCFSLIPLSMYMFTMGLSRNREFSITVALTTLFIWAAIPQYFYWGGVAEAMGYFLVPFFGLLDYRLNVNLMRNRFTLRTFTGATIIKFVLAAIAMYVHIYSLILFIFLATVVTPLWTIRNHFSGQGHIIRDKAKIYLKIVLPYLLFFFGAIILIIGAMMLLQLTGGKNAAIEMLYGYLFSSPQDIMKNLGQVLFTAPSLVFRNGYGLAYAAYTLSINMSLYLGGWGFAFVLLYLFFILYMNLSKNKKNSFPVEGRKAVRLTNVVVVATVILFLFSQDSPFGWYYIPYPIAITVLTDRLYFLLSLFMVYVEALPIYLTYLYIRKEVTNPSPRNKKGGNRGLVLDSKKHMKLRNVGTVVLVMVIIASITLPAMSSNYIGYVSDRGESVVTLDDLHAFSWIEANIPRNAMFFVNLNDAGGFVYMYTGRIVLPPYAIRAWDVTDRVASFNETELMLQEGNISQQLIQVLSGYNISYVYVGEKVQYGGPRFNTIALIQSPYFEIVFHQGGAYVFRITAP